jgi:hypothetical protein
MAHRCTDWSGSVYTMTVAEGFDILLTCTDIPDEGSNLGSPNMAESRLRSDRAGMAAE